jgi:esterase/lipase superfamily enzyme
MPLAAFGHYGKPLLLFPTGGGDYLEHERFLMIKALSPLIDAGRIKVYLVGNINREGWIDPKAHGGHKSWLQARFDDYLVNEVLPFVRRHCGGSPRKFAAAGMSLGAYNAVNVACKHPSWFDLVVTMSGTFDLKRWMGDHWDENYYFNHPHDYLPGLEGEALDELRRAFFLLAVGLGRTDNPRNSLRFGRLLTSKGIPNRVEVWGEDANHDWPTWRTMLPTFLDKLV